MKRICKECGQEFETKNGRQFYCNREHKRPCEICGTLFVVPAGTLGSSTVRTTCSRKCTIELRKRTNMQKYGGPAPMSSPEIQAKAQATSIERYGVAHAMQSDEILDKLRKTNLERYGVEYYGQTAEARAAVSEKFKDPEFVKQVKAKQHETNLERYGVKDVLASPEFRKKIHDSYFEKTGYYEPFANPEVRVKSEATFQKKYGVKHPIQNAQIMAKSIKTNRERYGTDNPMQNINILRKVQHTCLERYGNKCFLQSDLGRALHDNALNRKYGVPNYSQSYDWKVSRMTDPSKINNLMEFDEDPVKFLQAHYSTKPTLQQLSADIGTGTEAASLRIGRAGCQDMVAYVYSYMENEVYNALREIDSTMQIERNTHKYITPYELDIYLPEYKIGIECNPTSTHNSSINTFDKDAEPLKSGYHLMKTKLCEDRGIFLFHIFGSEWTYRRDVIKSMLRNLLGRNSNKVYARNCTVREIDSPTANEFLSANHRQGAAGAAVRLGLFCVGELVSVMTFGKMRHTIGSDSTDLSDCWELVRFCSVANTSVIGGASKLFKHFLNMYHPVRIRSFSDRAHTRGGLYRALGFSFVRASDPGYVWVDSRTDISYHRYNAQKQNIQKFLHDPDIDLSKSETQIMEEHGFLQMFDCGTMLWEYTSKSL